MASTDIALVNASYNKVNTGRDANSDSWMVMWTTVNFGDLLQPVPLSIALLGSVMVLATSVPDFKLIVERVKDDPNPPVQWTYVQRPDSFKSCLQQMVGDGCTAYETAHASMTTIRNRTLLMPGQIQQAVQIVFDGSPQEVQAFAPDLIECGILGSANICADAAKKVEAAFEHMCGFAQELVLGCTHKAGNAEQKLEANKIHYAVLQAQEDGNKRVLETRKATSEMMKNSFKQADDDFHEAVKQIPSGWDLVCMQAVESIVNLAVSAGNTAISSYNIKGQIMSAGIQAMSPGPGVSGQQQGTAHQVQIPTPGASTSPAGVPTLPTTQALTDPAVLEIPKTLALANALLLLLTGSNTGGPDWTKIHGTDASGAAYVQSSLQTKKGRLDPSKPYSAQLGPFIDTGVRLISHIISVGGSADAGSDSALQPDVQPTRDLITQLQSLNMAASLLLQQPGAAPTGMATPPPPAPGAVSGTAAQIAVKNAQFKANITRENLTTSRKSYEDASNALVDAQKQATETLAELTRVSMESAALETMLPILKKAVTTFTLLRAQFSKLSELFVSVASLVNDVLKPSVDSWAHALGNTVTKLAGVPLSSVTKQFIYTQMMVPLKVCTLSEKIATTYLSVSDRYIMPAQRTVGTMLQLPDDPSPAGREKLLADLRKRQGDLEKQANDAASGITYLVQHDQKQFQRQIDQRVDSLTRGLSPVLPEIT